MKTQGIYLLTLLFVGLLQSCNTAEKECEEHVTIYDTVTVHETVVDTIQPDLGNSGDGLSYLSDRLPEWFFKSGVLKGSKIDGRYEVDDRLNPFYLEADFNGDGSVDVVLPVTDSKSGMAGFTIVHGGTLEVFVIGAGTLIKNALSENMDYIDIWRVNRELENSPGLDEDYGLNEDGMLILENPSLEIGTSEIGGGLIYWDGSEYVYFHQTC